MRGIGKKILIMNIKVYLLFILSLILNTNVIAQFDSEGADEISRFKPGTLWYLDGWRPAKTDKIRKYDR